MTDKKPTDSSNVANKKPVPDDKYRGISFDMVVFDELHDLLMPDWAVGTTDTWCLGAQLCTKDGRVVGNAVIVGERVNAYGRSFWPVVTDKGNSMRLTDGELDSMFHPPRWIMNLSDEG